MSEPLRTAVVTGGHSYDVIRFRQLFRDIDDIDAYVQHIEDFASSKQEARDSYDAVVFFFMPLGKPSDEDHPWYAGKPRTVLEHLGSTSQGLVVLHHAALAYPEWPTWQQIAGLEKRDFDYHHDQSLTIDVADTNHPITRGLSSWTMIDETYEMNEPEPDCHILLTTDHPKSMKSLAWTRTYRNARVFTFVAGHDNQTWADEQFRTVLARGIAWTSRRLS
jgi:hypothetical protein